MPSTIYTNERKSCLLYVYCIAQVAIATYTVLYYVLCIAEPIASCLVHVAQWLLWQLCAKDFIVYVYSKLVTESDSVPQGETVKCVCVH